MGMGYGGDTDILASIYTSLLILICYFGQNSSHVMRSESEISDRKMYSEVQLLSRVCGNRGSVTVFGAWNEYTEGIN